MYSLFQQFHHLPVTGQIDNETLNQMLAPRCGFPDIIVDVDDKSKSLFASYKTGKPTRESSLEEMPIMKEFLSNFSLLVSKWEKTDLSYKIINHSKTLGKDKTT